MKVRLDQVRIAFPAVFEPESFNDGDPAYSASFLFPPDHVAVGLLNEAIDKVGAEKWGAKWPVVKKELTAKDKTCLHDGATKGDLAGFAGNLFVAARNKSRPTVVDRDRTPLTQSDGRIYGGCWVNALIEVWAQDNAYGKRVNAALRGVQFARDGDAFGGGGAPVSANDFDDISADAEDFADLI